MDKALVKDLLDKLNNLDKYNVDINDPGCNCCGVDYDLSKDGKLKDKVYYDDVVKATDVKNILNSLVDLLDK